MSPAQPPNPLNGRTGEYLRWVLTIVVGAVVAYFSAVGAMQAQIAVLQERETNHYQELIKRLDRIEVGLYGVGVGGR